MRQEEILGVIPATGGVEVLAQSSWYQVYQTITVGLVFATNVLIIARLMKIGAQRFAEGRYYALQREWTQFLHKPAETILDNKSYQCFVIPYARITDFGAIETGRFRKRCKLVFHTPEKEYVFNTVTDKKTIAQDLTTLLRQSGVKFSPGGMT